MIGKEIDPPKKYVALDTFGKEIESCSFRFDVESDSSRPEPALFTDKNVLHCELEMEGVIEKQVVKDIVVDQVRTENLTRDKISDHGVHQEPKEGDHILEEDGAFEDKEDCYESPASEENEALGVSKKHFKPSGLKYKSEVQNESITFNFRSPKPDDGYTKMAVADHDGAVSHKASEETDSKSSVKVNPQSLCYTGIPENSPVETESQLSQSWPNVSLANQLFRDQGEASFSAASLLVHSGSITYSGSLSLRSDGSATSARSFAFPILKPEWNSSPARMAKPDRRHFRKQKGWRSGFFCCRF